MRTFRTLLSVIGAVTVLVLAGNTVALATTGHSFILGKANKAHKVTTLKRTTNGPALKVVTKTPTQAPFAVNGRGKVVSLNADLVDGKHATDLGVRTRVYRQPLNLTNVSTFAVDVPSVAAGTYLVSYGAWIYGTAGSSSYCWIQRDNVNNQITANSLNTVNSSGFQPFSASGIIKLPATGFVRLYCAYSANQATLSTYSGAPIEITLTRVDDAAGSPLARTTSGARTAPTAP